MFPDELRHERAMDIRKHAVAEQKMYTLEGLAMIVCPPPDLLAVSLKAADAVLAEEHEERSSKRLRERYVSIADLAASL